MCESVAELATARSLKIIAAGRNSGAYGAALASSDVKLEMSPRYIAKVTDYAWG
jgi:hypothetical protein